MNERIWFLKNCDLLKKISSDQLLSLERHCQRRQYPASTPIYLPSENADSIYLVGSGLVKICHLTSDGRMSTLAYVKEGEVFGELALFDPNDRGEYVETVEASVLIRIPKQHIQELMNRELDIALAVTKMVGLRRQRIERRLRTLLFTSNQHRLNHLLLDLAEQFGIAIDGGIRLGLKLSHQEIANLIGTTRESVTILMGKLKNDGLVSCQRQTVILNDASRLAKSVGRCT